MRDNTWLKSSWTISIGTSIFSLLLTIGYDFSKNKPFFSTIWQILKVICSFVISILNFDLKVWWVIVGIIVIIAVIYLIDKIKQEETSRPDFYTYTQDKFKQWRWSWKWKLDSSRNAWVISDLAAHCPNCNTPMIEYSIYVCFVCPRCDFRSSDSQCDEPDKIERVILDNIERQRTK